MHLGAIVSSGLTFGKKVVRIGTKQFTLNCNMAQVALAPGAAKLTPLPPSRPLKMMQIGGIGLLSGLTAALIGGQQLIVRL